MNKYKIVNKERFELFIITLLSIGFISILGVTNLVKAQSDIMNTQYDEIYIHQGDTLWDIALKFKPDKYDVREMAYEIKEFNQLDDYYIYPGELIKIPRLE